MKNLLIIAAGGCGREVLQWTKDINEKENRWNIKGFLDDNLQALDGLKCDVPILATIDDYVIQPDDEFVCCIGNSNVRKMVVEKLKAKGAVFATLVHPNAVIAKGVVIDSGTAVMAGAVINPGATIGRGCIVNTCSSVDHDCIVSDYVHIAVGAHLCGTVTVGEKTWIGAGAVISNNLRICGDCMIGAGAVVVKDITISGKYLGVPAVLKEE